jgi:hypothetical protein
LDEVITSSKVAMNRGMAAFQLKSQKPAIRCQQSTDTGTLLTRVRKSYRERVAPPSKVHQAEALVGEEEAAQTMRANNAAA